MGGIELVYDYFEDHVKAAALIKERKPLALGVLCSCLGGLGLFLAQALSHRLFLPVSWVSCALVLAWQSAGCFLLAACVHLILAMAGAEGSAAALFVQLSLAELCWALAVPAVLVLKALAPGSSWMVTAAFSALGLWSVALKARGLKDNYQVSAGQAWLTLGLPYLALIGAGLVGVSLAVWAFIAELLKAIN